MPSEPAADRDRHYMRMALDEAERGRGGTRPNPMVGAVVVKGETVVGRGHHAAAGQDHAEVAALRDAGELARGAEIFVNLEPCSHHGRTPPCCEALVAAGVRRVVAAMIDPNPRVSGRGLKRLAEAGIETSVGVLETEARRLNEAFVMHMTEGRPFVTVKLAASLDGRIATHRRDSRWITGEDARSDVHRRRALADAVMVGPGTLHADDPLLTARLDGALHPRQPLRVALDPTLDVAEQAAILDTTPGPVLLLCADDADQARMGELRRRGVDVVALRSDGDGRLPLAAILAELGRREVQSLIVEGGGGLAGALLDARLVDRLLLYVAPMLIGGRDAVPAFGGEGAATVADALRAQHWTVSPMGEDMLIECDFR